MWAVAAARESAGRERICIVIESSTGQRCSVLLLGIWFLGLYTKHGATQWPHQSKGPWPTSKSFSLYLFLGSRWTKPDSHCSSAGGVTGGERREIQVIWLAPLSFTEGQRRPETGIPISWRDSRRPPAGATLALEPSLGFVCCAPGLGGWEHPKEHREGRMWPGLSEPLRRGSWAAHGFPELLKAGSQLLRSFQPPRMVAWSHRSFWWSLRQ